MKIIITTFILLFLLTGVCCSQTSTSSNAVDDNDGKKSQTATNTVPEFEAKKDESYKPWNAKVGDNMFVWDGNDLEIEFANKRKIELFSTYSAEEQKFQIEENDASECSMKFLYRPLAVAGNFVSYEIESGTLC